MEPLTIHVSQKSRRSLKIIVLIQVIICAVVSPVMIYQGFGMLHDIAFMGILAIGGGIFFLYIIVPQLRSAFESEIIRVNSHTLTVTKGHLFGSTSEEFLLNEPLSINYVGHREYTEHPMANNVVDFTGLAAGEKLVQNLADDGTLEIRSPNKIVRFGKDVPSWDAEKLIKRIERKTGLKLSEIN
ncbi:MAG: hypothetical protein IT236_18445 [Bacteroidia bacterium]|nr:hypothetical protein [Bacteroidia bacterium]